MNYLRCCIVRTFVPLSIFLYIFLLLLSSFVDFLFSSPYPCKYPSVVQGGLPLSFSGFAFKNQYFKLFYKTKREMARGRKSQSSKSAGKKPEGSVRQQNQAMAQGFESLIKTQKELVSELQRDAKKDQILLEKRNLALTAGINSMERRFQKMTPYDKAWIEQMLYPEMVRSGSAIISPALSPARAQASHFRLEHIIEGPIADNTTICVKPALYPVTVTTESPLQASGMTMRGQIDFQGDFQGEASSGSMQNGQYQLDVYIHTAQYDARPAFILSMDTGTVFNLSVEGFPFGVYNVWFHYPGGWSDMGTIKTTDSVVPFTAVQDVDAVSFSANGPDSFTPGPAWGVFDVTSPAVMTFTASTTHYPVKLKIPTTTEQYRITALAAKVTFFGSDIYNEGGVAGARVYPGWTPFRDGIDSAWDAVAQLPVNSYDGRIQQGAHCFWIPIDVKELDFRSPNSDLQSFDLSRFWFVVKGLNADASLRVELDVVVEFYSPEPVYNHDPTPYMSDKYGEILYYLGMQSPVGDNPGHLARLANIAKTVAKGVAMAGQVATLFL